ncbi:MAG: glycosyltransferase [Pirellulales bacterium]
MLRIAFCITELDAGGAERCLAELAARIDRQRFTPLVISLAGPPRQRERSVLPRLEAAGVEVRHLGLEHAWQVPAAVRRLAGWLDAADIDVLQTFLYHANVIGPLAARRLRKRPTGTPCVATGIRVAERRGGVRLHVERWTRALVDRHVCVSEAVARFSTEVGGLDPAGVVVIPNGVDCEAIRAAAPAALEQFGVADGRQVISYVGRIDAQKNVTWLLATAPTLLEQLPDHDLLLVGDGPLRRECEAQCAAAGIADRVHFAGWRADVAAVLCASELLVLPSLWEGMPNVVLEAMAAGIAVVANDVEGVREVLGPNGAEQIVPPGDRDAFVARIVGMLENDERRQAIGAANARRAHDVYSFETMVGSYESLYESLCDAREKHA